MVETQAAACVERQLVKGLENVTILSLWTVAKIVMDQERKQRIAT
jgi:hypothetical protein